MVQVVKREMGLQDIKLESKKMILQCKVNININIYIYIYIYIYYTSIKKF